MIRLFLWIMSGSQNLVAVFLYILLFKAANQKIIKLLKVYMGASAIHILTVQATAWVYAIYFSVNLPNARYTAILIDGIFKTYLIYGAYSYIQEITEEAKMASAFRELTDYEIHEFKNGQERPTSNLDFDMKPFLDRIQYVQYKKETFEISLLELQIDKRSPLGCGAFGTVYRAVLCRNIAAQNIPVAVKTTNPTSNNVEHFKALLSELKVMTIIGNHKNIVNLIGACTEDIKKRKLYIVVELCAFGNLQNYLKSQRGTFVDLTAGDSAFIKISRYSESVPNVYAYNSHISVHLNNDDDFASTKDLAKWAKEIADGMEFLESRKVIHGDLAARNVLLTEHKVAKITDFGLSRQLYNYSVYVKTENSQLPWRWLSLEAIMDMSFSTQSDVWSYGVTLWELFQLGETPWPGYKFGLNFVKELKHGMRLKKPTYATQNIYQIMMSCWDENPKRRPTSPLGCGTFGTVYRAILCRNTEGKNIPVAVKTTNPTFSNVEHFKALLSELKIMTVIGNHKNIVNLIGACTEDIKKRIHIISINYKNNVRKYLIHISIPVNNDDDLTSTRDLKRDSGWYGLSRISGVVHGDLAARNVLLTAHKVAKITDFGLSRQLYNYSVYVKTQNVILKR
ncbi:Vascular endothelial growth factor receptor 1 [Orchesella cincta]|uniref:Vascular endothelial growth factor receptor 1 n=1 Tax=Orchesella cincta TaxID=48709 RepID=A0A1D2MMP9_ORCCI|nr:Vascular endothelial growth factor receptor 1 [Orchesella cincta]